MTDSQLNQITSSLSQIQNDITLLKKDTGSLQRITASLTIEEAISQANIERYAKDILAKLGK